MSAAPGSSTFVVLGAGSWGTALAIQLARLSRPTVLWGRDPAHVAALARHRNNERYLPQAEFPDSLRVEAKAGDKTVWLCELQQAGAFGIRNVPAQDMQRLLGIFCPNYLLPYAREVISNLLTKGGFPPFLMPPVNFEALFNQASTRAQQGQPQSPAASVN